ncbi:MAG: hypothetical protein ACO1NS_10650 [Daejeonella sp.]|uniref:hypothetical protein n=1 Tax=Daejeonella sp. JGW-45 TaxID=3034148 RepID=UPI0023EB6AE2|nr:hypothetical protein [Daejeonella sp. JGW-45]
MNLSEKQPIFRSPEAEQFFDFYSHESAKEILWKWFTATVTDGFSELSQVEKENIISLYERLDSLLEGIQLPDPIKPDNNG